MDSLGIIHFMKVFDKSIVDSLFENKQDIVELLCLFASNPCIVENIYPYLDTFKSDLDKVYNHVVSKPIFLNEKYKKFHEYMFNNKLNVYIHLDTIIETMTKKCYRPELSNEFLLHHDIYLNSNQLKQLNDHSIMRDNNDILFEQEFYIKLMYGRKMQIHNNVFLITYKSFINMICCISIYKQKISSCSILYNIVHKCRNVCSNLGDKMYKAYNTFDILYITSHEHVPDYKC